MQVTSATTYTLTISDTERRHLMRALYILADQDRREANAAAALVDAGIDTYVNGKYAAALDTEREALDALRVTLEEAIPAAPAHTYADCSHRPDFASEAEHDRDCPGME